MFFWTLTVIWNNKARWTIIEYDDSSTLSVKSLPEPKYSLFWKCSLSSIRHSLDINITLCYERLLMAGLNTLKIDKTWEESQFENQANFSQYQTELSLQFCCLFWGGCKYKMLSDEKLSVSDLFLCPSLLLCGSTINVTGKMTNSTGGRKWN